MEEETIEVKNEFKLPNKKVTVRLVKRPRGVVKDENHVMYNMPPGVTFELCPKHVKGTSTIDCPLNEEEIKFFEDKKKSRMSFEIGDLSPHREKSKNFWYSKKAKVSLNYRDKILDLSKPVDYLTYKILLNNSDTVAPSAAEEFNKKSYVFVIVSEEEERKAVVKKGDKLKRAYKIASKMEDDTQAMIDYLTVVGKRPSENSKREFLIAEIDKQVEDNIDEFLSTLEDPQYETRTLISKALQRKAVLREGHKYFLPGGDPLCNKGDINNISNAMNYLDAPENQDIRLALEAKINE